MTEQEYAEICDGFYDLIVKVNRCKKQIFFFFFLNSIFMHFYNL